jgi:hypothetical protein
MQRGPDRLTKNRPGAATSQGGRIGPGGAHSPGGKHARPTLPDKKEVARAGGAQATNGAEFCQVSRPASILPAGAGASMDTFTDWPPILRAMRCAVERLYERDPARAVALHAALATLRGMPSFAAGQGGR